MRLAAFNTFCAGLPQATHVVQWRGSHVWKIGGKVFALASLDGAGGIGITFKCSRLSYDVLKNGEGLRPAPYFASRGMPWIQWTGKAGMDLATLRDYLRESYRLAALTLTVRAQRDLGLALGKTRQR